jgi:hypothetical protein
MKIFPGFLFSLTVVLLYSSPVDFRNFFFSNENTGGSRTSSSKYYNQPAKLPRIAIAGLAIESSTFSPALTNE